MGRESWLNTTQTSTNVCGVGSGEMLMMGFGAMELETSALGFIASALIATLLLLLML